MSGVPWETLLLDSLVTTTTTEGVVHHTAEFQRSHALGNRPTTRLIGCWVGPLVRPRMAVIMPTRGRDSTWAWSSISPHKTYFALD